MTLSGHTPASPTGGSAMDGAGSRRPQYEEAVLQQTTWSASAARATDPPRPFRHAHLDATIATEPTPPARSPQVQQASRLANRGPAPVQVNRLGVWINDGDDIKWIVRNLSFAAEAGQVIGLAGPSGSGKTTILMCLAGVTRHAEGQVTVAGKTRKPGQVAGPKDLSRIGVVFQDYHLVQSLDVIDNVSLPLRLDGISWRKARPAAAKMLAWFGLAKAMHRYPSQLSGGEQQRVAIARAMIRRPSVLLADEPTAHLDAKSTVVVAESLRSLGEVGTCVVVSSHDPRLLDRFEHVIDLGQMRR